MKNKAGFTVVEIIIVFFIIAFVSVLTFSNLLTENRGQKIRTDMKSVYMLLNNAISVNLALDGVDFRYLEAGDEKNEKSVYYMLKQRLFVTTGDSSSDNISQLGPNFGSSNYTLFLNNGMAISWPRAASHCSRPTSACRMVVDVNGIKGPNKLSTALNGTKENLIKDQFVFDFFDKKFLPHDSKAQYILLNQR